MSRVHCHRTALSPARGAFTLVELVLAMSMMGILGGALVSVIVIATRAIDNSKGPAMRAVAAGDAMQEIAQDVGLATSFTQRTAAGVTPAVLEFSVPDRDGDSIPEVIRYEWSGTPGAPLLRTYNGGPATTVATDVRQFSLSYLTRFRKAATPPIPPPQESAEVVHSTFDPTGTSTVGVSSATQYAEYFKPTLPTNTLSWKITRIEVTLARKSGAASGNAVVQIKNVDGAKKPTGAALDTSAVDVNTVSTSLTVVSFPFSAASGLDPAKAYCFAASGSVSSIYTNLQYKGGVDTGANIMQSMTTNSGGSWSTPTSTKALGFTVYGTYTTQGPPTW